MIRAASRTSASASTVTGSSVIMSATLEAHRLAQALLEAPQRLEEDDAAEQLDVVREVQVALLVGDDEVGLGDDADAAPALVDDRHARQVVGLQRPHDSSIERPGHRTGSASMISATVAISAAIRSTTKTASRRPITPPAPRLP